MGWGLGGLEGELTQGRDRETRSTGTKGMGVGREKDRGSKSNVPVESVTCQCPSVPVFLVTVVNPYSGPSSSDRLPRSLPSRLVLYCPSGWTVVLT